MAKASITIDVHTSKFFRDFCFAAGYLLSEIDEEHVLVSDRIKDAAAELRRVIEDHHAS